VNGRPVSAADDDRTGHLARPSQPGASLPLPTFDLVAARDLHLRHLADGRAPSGVLKQYGETEERFIEYLQERGVPVALEALCEANVTGYAEWVLPRHCYKEFTGTHAVQRRCSFLRIWARFLWRQGLLRDEPFRPRRALSRQLCDTHRMTELGQAIEACLLAAQVEGRSPGTVRTYKGQLASLLVYAVEHGFTTPESVTPLLVRRMAAERLTTSPRRTRAFKGGEATVRSLIHACKYFARWANTQGISVPDLSKVKGPRMPLRVQPRVTADEFRDLEQAAQQRVRLPSRSHRRFVIARDLALLSFLADTGLRAHEVCAMNISDVDLQTGTVIVGRGKGGNGRALCVRDADAHDGGSTLHLLRAYLQEREHLQWLAEEPGALWISSRGRRFSRAVLRDVLADVCGRAGVAGNRPPHAFRRTHFTEHYRADPAAIQVLVARMGWSPQSDKMIETYTRGAIIDLAATTPRPSIARRLRGDDPAQLVSLATSCAEGVSSPRMTAELIAVIRNDPALVRALLEALAS